jgi:chromosome partitioning protein
MRAIAVANQKGGSAKSTSCINLAAGLARGISNGKRVLLVDMDPQAAATSVLLGPHFALGPQQQPVVYELLMQQATAEEVIESVELKSMGAVPAGRLDVIPAHLNLAAAEMNLIPAFERERRLRVGLEPVADRYEFAIIDCPPSLGLLTVNALMAAQEVLIPVNPGFFPLIGLGLLKQTIQMLHGSNPGLHILGVLPVIMDHTVIARDTAQTLKEEFGDLVLPAVPERVAIKEAHAEGKDIFAYAPGSAAAEAYGRLTREVIRRG